MLQSEREKYYTKTRRKGEYGREEKNIKTRTLVILNLIIEPLNSPSETKITLYVNWNLNKNLNIKKTNSSDDEKYWGEKHTATLMYILLLWVRKKKTEGKIFQVK